MPSKCIYRIVTICCFIWCNFIDLDYFVEGVCETMIVMSWDLKIETEHLCWCSNLSEQQDFFFIDQTAKGIDIGLSSFVVLAEQTEIFNFFLDDIFGGF